MASRVYELIGSNKVHVDVDGESVLFNPLIEASEYPYGFRYADMDTDVSHFFEDCKYDIKPLADFYCKDWLFEGYGCKEWPESELGNKIHQFYFNYLKYTCRTVDGSYKLDQIKKFPKTIREWGDAVWLMKGEKFRIDHEDSFLTLIATKFNKMCKDSGIFRFIMLNWANNYEKSIKFVDKNPLLDPTECCVCLEEDCKTFTIMCNHPVCESCSCRLADRICPMCRTGLKLEKIIYARHVSMRTYAPLTLTINQYLKLQLEYQEDRNSEQNGFYTPATVEGIFVPIVVRDICIFRCGG